MIGDAPASRRAFSGPEDTFIPVGDGARLAAEVWPSRVARSRRAVVFVHGFCGNRQENGLFAQLAEACAANGLTAVLYDWRGLGTSEGNFSRTSLDDHVADFQHVLDWVGQRRSADVDELSAVGFSLGAAVVGSALRRRPQQLSAVAYLSPAMRPRLSMWPRYKTPRIMHELARRGVVEKPDSSVLLGRPILTSLRTTDLGPSAFDVDVPLLVCHGTADTRIDCSHTRELVTGGARPTSEAEQFRYEEFPDASHSFRPADRHWGRLSSMVADWLAGTATAEAAGQHLHAAACARVSSRGRT